MNTFVDSETDLRDVGGRYTHVLPVDINTKGAISSSSDSHSIIHLSGKNSSDTCSNYIKILLERYLQSLEGRSIIFLDGDATFLDL